LSLTDSRSEQLALALDRSTRSVAWLATDSPRSLWTEPKQIWPHRRATADDLLRCKLACVSDSQLLVFDEAKFRRLSVQVTLSVGRRAC
jgi:hypothetical protein